MARQAFNQPLNPWDMAGVTDVHRMFENAESFNQPLDKCMRVHTAHVRARMHACMRVQVDVS